MKMRLNLLAIVKKWSWRQRELFASSIFLSLLLFCFHGDCPAQQVAFTHLNINDGLSQNAVFAITQDRKGFMWFGTKDGLNRYDGYHFEVFQHDPFDSTSISSSFVTALYEDSKGRIWVGTEKEGVCYYDYKTERFHRIPLRSSIAGNSGIREVCSITEDRKGAVWIGTKGDGIFQVVLGNGDAKHTTFKQYLHDPANNQSLCHNVVSYIYAEDENTLWLSTHAGLCKLELAAGIFTHFLIKTKNPRAPASEFENSLGAIAYASERHLWIGAQGGLIYFTKSTGDFVYYPHKFDVFRYGWGAVKSIVKDREGALWLPTAAMLMKFDTKTHSYRYFTNDPSDPESIAHNAASSAFADQMGNIWIGTNGFGISRIDPKANRFHTLKHTNKPGSRISGFSIRSILEESKDVVWISGELLYRWDRKNNAITSYETSSNRPDDFGNTGVWSMIKASDNTMWFATNQGLFYYDPVSSRAVLIKNGTSGNLPQRSVYAVYEDKRKAIWVMTENYICRLKDIKKGIFECYRYNKKPSFGELVRPVMYQDEDDIFWLGTNEGFLRFNPTDGSFTEYMVDPTNPHSIVNHHIKSICPDPKNPKTHLWIGTSGGLSYFSKKYGRFINYTEKNGLPNNVVYAVLPDGEGNLWLSTNKGLSKFNPESRKFRNFDVRDGLQSNEFNTGAYFRSKDGELYFGGIIGLNYFYPDQIRDTSGPPPMVLTSIEANAEKISHTTHPELIDGAIHDIKRLRLSYRNKVLVFHFRALDYSAPEKNQYAYKLENYNSDWIYAGLNNSATYTNLPPGTYTFRVKGANSDGVWNEEGTSLMLTITPPWWATWWAYFGYSLILIGSVLWIRKYEMNRLKLKNQLAIGQIETRSLKELDKMKNQFFTNISHEFRTPLTLITGQLESVLSDKTDEKILARLNVANRNAEKLLNLINQIMDLSKIDAHRMPLHREEGDWVGFLKNAFFSFESLARNKGITLEFHTACDKVPMAFDKEKMETMLSNLISNAVKFTPSQGKIILRVLQPYDKKVQITLEDTGVGISAVDLPHIFERFYQADHADALPQMGSGVGLSLVEEIVKLHGGTIQVKSEPGKGTLFTITLPVEIAFGQAEKQNGMSLFPQNPETENIDSELRGSKKELILLVEDNDEVRHFIQSLLQNAYQVLAAGDAIKGFELAKSHIPDLIITDVMMPGNSGYDFSKQLREEEKTCHIPIIMLTAKGDFEDKIAGLELGIDDYITKPFKSRELLLRAKNLIEQRKQMRMRFSRATRISPSEVTAVSIDQLFLEKVIKVIENQMHQETFAVEHVADALCMSVSQLNKKLNALIGQPGGQLIRSLRLQKAADLIVKNAGSISEICYQVGYSDQAYFSRAFKKYFGCAPTAYRQSASD
jgi:signal transduction histidine kinase/ligand-binding sensor domain-containing protein/DNA-binding response OmpR family regulator